ncbi:class I SAM-dependent methyltransferase [Proteiniphilum sp.]|uniref:class I SAM-dependent methyltransferase n=1 Tax=Proteiniphilum sp. TaxID=1926877 RepID=UPI002B1FB670|nr:methyltransferase domain-containing protein [Proteiniphilum sp.]MEA4917388.1 methyltransferase domain-containing protein [Proteiniphilum sp.]
MAKTEKKLNIKQGHWILAKLGKRVLRPGGIELTEKMIESLNISTQDDVVEFAPGLGLTAKKICSFSPKSYTAVEINEEAANIVRNRVKYDKMRLIVANAVESTLPDSSVDKVYCEAMLTMQSNKNKGIIISEAARILRPGGYYAIHEICLIPDNVSDTLKKEIYRDLANAIQVNARPITVPEWKELFVQAGLEVVSYHMNHMHLLEPKRVINDEGVFRTIKIGFNVLTHPSLRSRVLGMRRIFRKYEDSLRAITFLTRKV